mmetsp:Transcript_43128/g.63302  ORF Transcript_43128/g.63302 Transcript_43128/m.63302 type:complete len:230 (+) Transcript_43128:496-1185(+)
MLPSSWPGRKEESMQGRPEMAASAMVPGPALVMMQSTAPIHSSMFFTKPLTTTFTFAGRRRRSSADRTSSFLPHTTTTCDFRSACWPRRSMTEVATACRPPTPSPPPTTSTARSAAPRPSSRRSCAFVRFGAQKPSRTGRPCWTIWPSWRPHRLAVLYSASEGTNTRSARGSNQVGCALPRSVTTVAKGTLRFPPPIALSAFKGMSWQRGWTLITRSGFEASMHFLKLE